jgi:hypothetical protein
VTASRKEALERLQALRELGAVLERELAKTPAFDYYWATLRYGEFGLEARVRWCDDVIARLGKRARQVRLPRERLK